MAKKTKQMIKVQITGYVPAADIMDMASVQKQHKTLNDLRQFASEQMQESEFSTRVVNRLVEAGASSESDKE